MHIAIWNRWLNAAKKWYEDQSGYNNSKLQSYIGDALEEGLTAQDLALHVKVIKVHKCYDDKWKNVQVAIVSGTKAGDVWQDVQKFFLRTKATPLLGTTPKGDNERRLQEIVDSL